MVLYRTALIAAPHAHSPRLRLCVDMKTFAAPRITTAAVSLLIAASIFLDSASAAVYYGTYRPSAVVVVRQPTVAVVSVSRGRGRFGRLLLDDDDDKNDKKWKRDKKDTSDDSSSGDTFSSKTYDSSGYTRGTTWNQDGPCKTMVSKNANAHAL